MNHYSNIEFKNNNYGYQKIIVLLMFIVGLLNSSIYFSFMGVNVLNVFLLLLFYSLIGFMCFIILLNYLYKRKGKIVYSFPYWLILTIAVMLKFIILFIQFPLSFLPGEDNFNLFISMISILLLMIVLIKGIHNMYYLKATIWCFGIGASFSASIPLFFYPEMIGQRTSLINNYVFTGAFWNSAVISYISVGWLLIAISIDEKSKIKKWILMSMFLLLVLAGLAGLSRATLVSLIISVIVYLIMSNKFKEYLKVIIFTSFLLLVSFVTFQEPIENFGKRFNSEIVIEDESRINIWNDYIENIPDYFFLGEIEGNHLKYSKTDQAPHSVLLNWLAQYGILGLLGFGILLIGILKSIQDIKLRHSKQVAAALYAWLAAYLSLGLINETGFSELAVFGGIGIILSWGNIIRNAEKQI